MSDRHPSAERLAEYLDDVLSKGDRAEVERHLADCADCRDLVSETMDLIVAEETPFTDAPPRVPPFWERGWVRGVAVGLAAAAVLVLAIRVVRPQWLGIGPRTDRQELIAALADEPTRPVEGWLSGGWEHRAPPLRRRGPRDDAPSPQRTMATAKIERAAQGASEVPAIVGTAYLIDGRLDQAIATLSQACAREPRDAQCLNDLAVAYIERGVRQSRQEDFSSAREAAARALDLVPGFPEAAFNQALALEYGGQRAEAVDAWRRVQRLNISPAWLAEVAQHLASMTAQP